VSDFDELYQEIILDHYRSPRGAARLDHIPESAILENPTCGDSIKVEVLPGPDGSSIAIRFENRGCAISTASASLMTLALGGRSPAEARELALSFIRALRGEAPIDLLDAMGDLVALKGVASYPVRVKCATLAWHALLAALEGA
jgi:nitrogen fixation protein NifU and related proteins